jgi:S-phase kinase-associated protein 1
MKHLTKVKNQMKTNKNLLKTVLVTLLGLGLGTQLMAMEKRQREESEEEALSSEEINLAILPPSFEEALQASQKKTKKDAERPQTIVPLPAAMPLAPELLRGPKKAENDPSLAIKEKRFGGHAVKTDVHTAWENQQDNRDLILQSNDGQEFVLPVHTAQLSETIRNLIEDAGTDNPIPLPNVDGRTLAKIVQLLPELEWLMAQSGRLPTAPENGVAYVMKNDNYVLQQDELLYVPRAFQPTANNALQDASTNEVIDLLAAANYLDIPFIINAAAAVLADRIVKITTTIDPTKLPAYSETYMVNAEWMNDKEYMNVNLSTLQIPKDLWKHLIRTMNLRSEIIRNIGIYANQDPNIDSVEKENAQAYLKELNLNFIARIDKNILQKYIIRHLVYRQCGITQERSIADKIREKGLPRLTGELTEYYDYSSEALDLTSDELTSLFGIQLISNTLQSNRGGKQELTGLFLGGNCLFDLSLDPQGIEKPFNHFPNLIIINLEKNQLIKLNPGLFNDLKKLRVLDLSDNSLSEEQKNRIRKELEGRDEIDLMMD